MLFFNKNENNKFEINKHPSILSYYKFWSSNLKPAGIRYILYMHMLKSLKWAKIYLLYQ